MKSTELSDVVKILCEKLTDKGIDWVIVGTASLALQGMDISPSDVDIVTTKNGAYEIYESLKEYATQEVKESISTSGRTHSWFGKLAISGVVVEINGDPEIRNADGCWIRTNSQQKKQYINLNNYKVPVVPISYVLEMMVVPKFVPKDKDTEKIRKIRQYLRETS